MDITVEGRASGGQASRAERNVGEVLNEETRQLMKHFLGESTGVLISSRGESEALSTLKRIARRLLEKYGHAYNGMIKKLPADDGGDNIMMFVSAVARSVFADGIANWGRVASLAAFGFVLCEHLKGKGRLDRVESVGDEIATYLLTDQKDFLLKNNCWVGFVEFFAEPRPPVQRDTLIFFVTFAGIGALTLLNTFRRLLL